ncbi:MAG: potassium channel protein [Planctomycetaceae bacterium]
MKRTVPILALLASLLTIGVIAFRLITGRSWIECLYLAVVTLTTLGNREPAPLGEAGMIFVVVYLLCGAGTLMFGLTQLGQWIVSDELRIALENRRMNQTIAKYHDHMLVCGCGQMGEIICRQLSKQGRLFVAIDTDLERLRELCGPNSWSYLHGDATDDELLKAAGIDRAGGLATVLSSDAANLYVVISAKRLNPDIAIVARATENSAGDKLRQVGAGHVINPYQAGAVRMARLLIHSGIDNLLEIVDGHHADLELAEIPVSESGPLAGQKISDSGLQELGIMVIAIRRLDGSRRMPVHGDDRLDQGDSLLVVGQQEAIQGLLTSAESA